MDYEWFLKEMEKLAATARALLRQNNALGRRIQNHHDSIMNSMDAPTPKNPRYCVVCLTRMPSGTENGGAPRRYCSEKCRNYAAHNGMSVPRKKKELEDGVSK